MTTFGLDLPQNVLDLAEFSPVEDVLLAILREDLEPVPVVSLIPEDTPPFFILVRQLDTIGDWDGDERFVDSARFFVHVFTSDPDGDEKGAVLSEAVRVVLRNAWLSNRTIPDRGTVVRIKMEQKPVRKTDWATSSGPVQFADLPTGVWRYESVYTIRIRKPA